jgi:hypothetical protein
VCTDQRADAFTSHHALVQITAPFHQAVPEYNVVVLLDDLHLFTQTWYYSALSYPMLNDRLSTTFILRGKGGGVPAGGGADAGGSGGARGGGAERSTSLALQRRLLLPFAQVKGLYQKRILGYSPEIAEELDRLMATPIPTLEECCEKATDLMQQGDHTLHTTKDPQAALALYISAFHAIHILIHARTRRVLADVFFHAPITSGRYSGQTGITVRVILRLKLVARCVLAYNTLGAFGDAAFFGMRSIRIMREAMDPSFEVFITNVVGGDDVGMIYVRTGIALWKMQRDLGTWGKEVAAYDGEDAESVWGAAVKFWKMGGRDGVQRELEAFGAPVMRFGEGEAVGEGEGGRG